MKKETIYEIFSNIPKISTERLTLRALRELDAEDVFEYASLPEVTKYLLWSEHPTLAYTKEFLAYIENRYALGDFYDWAVTMNDTGKVIGTCGFTSIDAANNSGEVGYVLNPDFHGRGYAPEAAKRVIDFGFTELNLHRIEAKFMKENTASLHVMEKLGMTLEGYRRDGMLIKQKYRTIGICSILREEWLSKQGEQNA